MSSSDARRVLLTGAAGFVGSRCMSRLVAAGYEVHAVGHRSVHAPGERAVTWHQVDLTDGAACERAIGEIAPSHMLHLAWIATPGVFWRSPENLAWLAAGVRLVDAFFRRGGIRAVGVGTCAEYEWSAEDSIEGRTPLSPDTIYGRCKLALGLAFEAAAQVHSRSAAWARLFFPYGPGEAQARLIPAVISGLLRSEQVQCTHGTQVRDFVHVDDVADALVALVGSEAQGAFNVGSGVGRTLREVVAEIVKQVGLADHVIFGARQPPAGDPPHVVADISRIRRELGWQPKVGIEAGIASAIEAWRDRIKMEGSSVCGSQ